jgi:hypothetical protein
MGIIRRVIRKNNIKESSDIHIYIYRHKKQLERVKKGRVKGCC